MRLKVPWAHAQRNNGFTKSGMVGSRTAERWAHFNVICILTIMDDIITLTVYFPDVTYDRIQEHTETEFNVAEQLAVMKGMV